MPDIILESLLTRYYHNHSLAPSEIKYLLNHSKEANRIAIKLNRKLNK